MAARPRHHVWPCARRGERRRDYDVQPLAWVVLEEHGEQHPTRDARVMSLPASGALLRGISAVLVEAQGHVPLPPALWGRTRLVQRQHEFDGLLHPMSLLVAPH